MRRISDLIKTKSTEPPRVNGSQSQPEPDLALVLFLVEKLALVHFQRKVEKAFYAQYGVVSSVVKWKKYKAVGEDGKHKRPGVNSIGQIQLNPLPRFRFARLACHNQPTQTQSYKPWGR